jgi:hypothetical protein
VEDRRRADGRTEREDRMRKQERHLDRIEEGIEWEMESEG